MPTRASTTCPICGAKFDIVLYPPRQQTQQQQNGTVAEVKISLPAPVDKDARLLAWLGQRVKEKGGQLSFQFDGGGKVTTLFINAPAKVLGSLEKTAKWVVARLQEQGQNTSTSK